MDLFGAETKPPADDTEAISVTNDESTWTRAARATASDQASFDRYVGAMGSDFVRSAVGGQEEVSVGALGLMPIHADILTSDGVAVEVKVGYVSAGSGLSGQVDRYRSAHKSRVITNFCTVFLKGPASGLTGPSQSVADMLTAKGVNSVTFPLDWWDSYY